MSTRNTHCLCDDVGEHVTGAVILSASERQELQRLEVEHLRLTWNFTPPRQMIYILIKRSGAAGISAYQLLEIVKKQNSQAKPAFIYRAIKYLTDAGLVIKIHSQARFIVRADRAVCFMAVCSDCGAITAIADASCERKIAEMILHQGLGQVTGPVEMTVICAACLARP